MSKIIYHDKSGLFKVQLFSILQQNMWPSREGKWKGWLTNFMSITKVGRGWSCAENSTLAGRSYILIYKPHHWAHPWRSCEDAYKDNTMHRNVNTRDLLEYSILINTLKYLHIVSFEVNELKDNSAAITIKFLVLKILK